MKEGKKPPPPKRPTSNKVQYSAAKRSKPSSNPTNSKDEIDDIFGF